MFGINGLCISVMLLAQSVAVAAPAALFVDLVDHPVAEANWDRFHGLEDHLAAAFFNACDRGSCVQRRFLWPLQLRCSVRRADATVAACIWVIAGSDLRIRAAGSIEPDVVIWRCPLPLRPGLGVEPFHAALDVAEPLQVRLPGASVTLLQGLRRCLMQSGSST